MCRFRCTVRGVICRDFPRTCGSVKHVDGAIEEGERRERLIVGNLMTSLVDPSEAEIAVFARLAVFNAIDDHRGIACGAEFLGAGEVCCQTDCFAAEPVANVIYAMCQTRSQYTGWLGIGCTCIAVDKADPHR
jgi:hypothetical protein